MAKKIRGSGIRHTLPYVLRFAGLWLVVTIAAIVVASVSSYMVFAQRASETAAAQLRTVVTIQAVLSILAVIALAVFTTHRLAGPYVALMRAFEAVKNGDLTHPLRFRRSDIHLRDVEISFDEMTAALRERLEKQGEAAGEA